MTKHSNKFAGASLGAAVLAHLCRMGMFGQIGAYKIFIPFMVGGFILALLGIFLSLRRGKGSENIKGIILSIIAILILITLPNAPSYRHPTSEAWLSLDRISAGLEKLYADHGAKDGTWVPKPIGWTPPESCCEQNDNDDEKCSADRNRHLWNHPTWLSLGFARERDFYFQYRVKVEGDEIVLQASADMDCDGEKSLYERRIKITDKAPDVIVPTRNEKPLE